jgi:cytochrome P450
MLAHQPVAELPELNAWGVFRYDDCVSVLRNDVDFSIARRLDRIPPEQQDFYFATGTLVGMDPPRHTRLRALSSAAFRPKVIDGLRPYAEKISRDLLEAALAKGDFDFLDAYATPLPQAIITEMMGVPGDNREHYFKLTEDIENSLGRYVGSPISDEQVAMARRAHEELCTVFDEIFEDRRKNPREDLVTGLVQAEVDGEKLSQWELQKMAIFAYFAAFTTTQGLLSNLVMLLDRFPDQLEKLRNRRDLIPNAIEEALRWRTPAPAITRMTTTDVKVGDCIIPANSMVLLFMHAANHDSRMFETPHRFDIERKNAARHLAFAFGAHFCLGAPLAKMEANVFLNHWLDRVREFKVTQQGPMAWDPENINVLVLRHLPVHAEAA